MRKRNAARLLYDQNNQRTVHIMHQRASFHYKGITNHIFTVMPCSLIKTKFIHFVATVCNYNFLEVQIRKAFKIIDKLRHSIIIFLFILLHAQKTYYIYLS